MSTRTGTTSGENTPLGEQISLFDVGMNLTEVRSVREEIVTHSKAVNTVKAYKYSWVAFTRWCESAGRQPLPASPDTVSLFAAWACQKRDPPYKLSHVRHLMAAIHDRHRSADLPNPVNALVKETLAGIGRKIDQEPGGKDALSPANLRRAIEGITGDTPIAVRDRALLLVGYTTGWRSSELAGLRLREARFYSDHVCFHLRRSKTDQFGKGREVRIPRLPSNPLCPVAALEAWVKIRGNKPGSLFLPFQGARLTPTDDGIISADVVRHVLQRRLKRCGVDPATYGAHSLRSGMVTAAAENGADVLTIQQRTGHKSLEMIARYVRAAGGFRRDPLAGVL